jgi:hypothetical protein
MATRSIVTSHPDVACDVCGRRLLRGEHPDTFLTGGQQRVVCELCAPRAAREGWMRMGAEASVALPAPRPRRATSLLGRLLGRSSPPARRERAREDQPGPGDLLDGAAQNAVARERDRFAEELRPRRHASPESQEGWIASSQDEPSSSAGEQLDEPVDVRVARAARARRDLGVERLVHALELFNRGEHPRRIAGVARSLGPASVSVRALEAPVGEAQPIVIVVAWELCWYRYQVDLAEPREGALLVAQGLELAELSSPELTANASADERGRLSLDNA